MQALKNRGISPEGKKVMIFGAGGAAKAISVECALAGAEKVTVVNRTKEKADELAEVIRSHTKAEADSMRWMPCHAIPEGTDIVINATCVGFAPNCSEKPDIDYNTLTPEMIVCDVVFNPCDTLFLKTAAEHGAVTVRGLGMLACQGALNFTLWTGVEAPLEIMEEQLRREFSED